MTLPRGRRVLVDSGAWFAMINGSDNHHDSATKILRRITLDRAELFTTNFIVAESHALLLNRYRHSAATAFLKEIDDSGLIIVRVSERDEGEAKAIIYGHSDKEYTLADATAFVVMRRLGLTEAFAFDHNFGQYGFELAQP